MPSVNMTNLIQDVIQSIKFIHTHAVEYNGTTAKIALIGHSCGGHLAMLTYLMMSSSEIRSSISCICSLSGIFDLKPIQNSYLNIESLHLSNDDVQKYSVVQATPGDGTTTTTKLSNKDGSLSSSVHCPVMIAVGGGETKFFINESKKVSSNNNFEYHEFESFNHYEMAHLLLSIGKNSDTTAGANSNDKKSDNQNNNTVVSFLLKHLLLSKENT